MFDTDGRLRNRFRRVGVAVAALIASGCGVEPEAVALPSLTDSGKRIPSSTASQEEAVASAYTKFVAMLERADSLPDESRKRQLATVMVDPQLSRVLRRVDEMKSQNIATYGHIVVHVKGVQIAESGATVYDCRDSRNSGLLNSATQKKINRGVQQEHAKALLVKGADGQWRVSKSTTLGEGC